MLFVGPKKKAKTRDVVESASYSIFAQEKEEEFKEQSKKMEEERESGHYQNSKKSEKNSANSIW